MKQCPKCGNANEYTFGIHYAYVPGYKSKIDANKGFYYCIDCEYRSDDFELDGGKRKMPKIVINAPSSVPVVKVNPAKAQKINLVVEIDRHKLEEAMKVLEMDGFKEVKVQF